MNEGINEFDFWLGWVVFVCTIVMLVLCVGMCLLCGGVVIVVEVVLRSEKGE
jgi:hypothetical protein